MKKIVTVIVLLLAMVLVLTSCGNKEEAAENQAVETATATPVPESPYAAIYGVWESAENGMEFHLDRDNTGFMVQNGKGGITMSYEIDDAHITATSVNPDGSKIIEILGYALDGDTLTLQTDTFVACDADGNETERREQELGMTFTRKTDAAIQEGPLLGVWYNAEQDVELHLKGDGMAYTVLGGDYGPNCLLEFDDHQFSIRMISSFGYYSVNTYEYTLDGDTLTITKMANVTYNSDGTENGRQESEEQTVFTRK